jgi:hypothetical protein
MPLPAISRACSSLSLSLFMFRIRANHAHHTFAMDDLAVIAHLFYGSSYLHVLIPQANAPTGLLAQRADGLVCLLISICNPAAIEIVRRKLNQNFVTGQNSDEMFAHLSRNMGQHLMLLIAVQLDTKHRIGQRFEHLRHYFYRFFFGHILIEFLTRKRAIHLIPSPWRF